MADTFKVVATLAYLLILCSTGAHVAGLLTDFWFTGTADTKDATIQEVNIGLWSQNIKYANGTEFDTDTSQLRREVQYIVMAVAGINALLCTIVLVKSVHVCVGLIAFIVVSLLILCAFYTFEGASEERTRLQGINGAWPLLNLSWSFYLVAIGLIVNVLSTLVFLTCLLLRGEKKAEKSKLVLVETNFDTASGGKNRDRTPIVNTISDPKDSRYDNYAFSENEAAHAHWAAGGASSGSAFGYASPSSVPDPAVDLDDVDTAGSTGRNSVEVRVSNSASHYPSPYDNTEFSDISVVESSRL